MDIRTYLAIGFLLVMGGCSIKDSSRHDENLRTYSWIEIYADGHRDTVFSKDTLGYPQQIQWTFGNQSTDSSSVGGVDELDTIYLNYGANARDSLVSPRVRIENKSEILAALDTIFRFQSIWPRANVKITHFRGDSLVTRTLDSAIMAFLPNPPTTICHASDSCMIGYAKECTQITYKSDVVFTYDFGVNPNLTDSSVIRWKFVLQNRFGFKDSLEGVSEILSPPEACVNPKVDQCQEMLVYKVQDTLFSWVEGYADGHKDTVYHADSAAWIGSSPITLQIEHWNRIIEVVFPIQKLTMETICPGDSLVLSGGSSTPHFYPDPDTVRINYSKDSLYPYAEPVVRFKDKDSLILAAATAQYFNDPMRESVWISHFRGDSAEVEIQAASPLYLNWSPSDVGGCYVQNPCDSLKVLVCVDVDYGDYNEWPHLGITLDEATSGKFPWTLIVRNRFGYADTVSGVTTVSPFTCN